MPGGWLLWVFLVLTATAAAVLTIRAVRTRRRKRRSRQVTDMVAWPGSYSALALREASDEELCRLWRATGERLRTVCLPSTLEWIVEVRRLTLDELAERDPVGFARWISGQPLTTDPRTFIRH
jgi:hypothetical protein